MVSRQSIWPSLCKHYSQIEGDRSYTDGLSAELRAVLSCARTVVDRKNLAAFASALSDCPSAELLVRTAGAHGMLGHLHRLVSTEAALAADMGLKRRLSDLQRAAAAHNLRDAAVLLAMLGRLEAAGVQAMPVKGPVWAELLYGDLGLRSWSDLDLVVDRERVVAARAVLLENGFSDCSDFNERTARLRGGGTGQIAMGSRELGLVFDLHWKLTVSLSPRGLTFEPLFARSETMQLLGRSVVCPSKSDVFLITCLEGTRDLWSGVSRLLDLAVQVDRTTPSEWGAIMDAAREAGCERRTLVAVAHVCRVLGMETPRPVAEGLAGDSRSRALVRSLRPQQMSGMLPEGVRGRLALLRWQVSGEDRRLDGLRLLTARLFVPSTEDWETFTLPPWAEWLHYPLRPCRLAAKWAKHLLLTARRANHVA